MYSTEDFITEAKGLELRLEGIKHRDKRPRPEDLDLAPPGFHLTWLHRSLKTHCQGVWLSKRNGIFLPVSAAQS